MQSDAKQCPHMVLGAWCRISPSNFLGLLMVSLLCKASATSAGVAVPEARKVKSVISSSERAAGNSPLLVSWGSHLP